MANRDFWHGAVVGTAAVLTGTVLFMQMGTHAGGAERGVLSDERNVEKIQYLEQIVDEEFLFDIDEDRMAEGMFAGLLAGLGDPYTYYYTPEEYEEENVASEGSYVGIGVSFQKNEDGGCKIVEVYAGFPGDQAGLEPGDLIVGVNGEDVTDMTSTEVALTIKGEEGTQVQLTVYKPEATEPLELELTLSHVEIPSVEWEMLDEENGYIRITEFMGVTSEQFASAMQDLRDQGMQRLVVDVRNNPGGLLYEVCDLLEQILPAGLIVYTEDKYGQKEEIFGEGETPLDIPLAVLVNGNSASASEIFAGAIKDYGIGTIVGTKTFGKGIVQSLHALPDGSAMQLTIANYFTPNGVNIHNVGIEPDVEVKVEESLLNRTDFTHEEDNQLQEALNILRENAERNTEE
ncbi:MAG: S41 family peptidase [Clostridiales bacterium]|nr:S41 family peptidase [Candidatus Blautia equi]